MYTVVNREYIHTSPTHLTPFGGAHTYLPRRGAHPLHPLGGGGAQTYPLSGYVCFYVMGLLFLPLFFKEEF